MRRTLFVAVITIFFVSNIFANIDSLKNILTTTANDSNKVILLNKISCELWYDDIDEALTYCDKALLLAKEIDYKSGIAQSYKYKGICYYYQDFLDKAVIEYLNSLKIYEEILDNKGIYSSCSNIGQVYWIQAKYKLAFDYFTRSLSVAKELGDKESIARSYNGIGIIFYSQGNYEKALENYLKSLGIYEKIQDKRGIAYQYDNIANIYQEQEKLDMALVNYLKSLAIQEELDDNEEGIVTTYGNIGQIYETKKEFGEALNYYHKSLNLAQKNELSREIAVAFNNLGGTNSEIGIKLKAQNQDSSLIVFNKSIVYFSKGLSISTEIGDQESVAISNSGLGRSSIYLKNYNDALNYLNKAKVIGSNIGAPDIERTAAEYLSEAYSKLGLYKKAYENQVLFKSMADSLRNDKNIENITKMEMQFDFDKIQIQKDLEYQAELKRQRIVRYSIIIVLLIVVAFAAYAYRNYRRKRKDNILLGKQKEKIEKQKEEITDSIRYAKRIQQAVVPTAERAKEILPEHFILWRPRDIVSGDFWWMRKKNNKIVLVAADSTGHGVPGAFMSMLGVSFLNEIVSSMNDIHANEILNQLRTSVKTTLQQTGKEGEAKDGMDLALVVLDLDNNIIQYSGAYNPLYIIRNGELLETKADRNPIGIYIKEKDSFTNHEIPVQKGDTLYIFSDGFVDQFGGERQMKFKSKRYKQLLLDNQHLTMPKQKDLLNTTIDDWRGNIDQIDDIIIIGVRI